MLVSRIKVRGTHIYQAVATFKNGSLKHNSEVYLKHNPENPHDKNAVEIRLMPSGAMLGHVSKEIAPKYAKLSDTDSICKAYVSSADLENNYIDLRIVVIYEVEETRTPKNESTFPLPHVLNLPDKPGIYAIKNILTGRMYIGSSKNVKYRFATHIRELDSGRHVNKPLQTDYNKFGAETFEAVLLVGNTDIEQLLSEEMAQITYHLNRGIDLYNMTEDGQGRVTPYPGVSSISERKVTGKRKNQLAMKNIEEFTAILHAKANADYHQKSKNFNLNTLFRWIYDLFVRR